MYLTIHAPTSLIIGSSVPNPILAFILAFIAHLAWDTIPHDSKKLSEWANENRLSRYFLVALIDFIVLGILLLILWQTRNINFTWSMVTALVGGILPDVLWGLNVLTNSKIKIIDAYSNFHSKTIHRLLKKKFYLSVELAILIQLLVFGVTLFIYLTIL